MAKIVDRATYSAFFKKGEEHEACGNDAVAAKRYNAAVTNYTIAVINYLDALSVNLFGRTLNSENHEGAPHLLLKSLNGAGIVDFRKLAVQCGDVLRLKSAASYRSEEVDAKDARLARKTVQGLRVYVDDKLDKVSFRS